MDEAWIQLQCPDCETTWEENPADLPEPGAETACEACGDTRSACEFMHTARDLEILEEFH